MVLRFNENIVEQPVTYNLITDYGIRVNILRASIDPGKKGKMVVELNAEKSQLSRGLNYLESIGVQADPLAEEIRHMGARCTSCTSCVPHCPTQALDVDRSSWQVGFDAQRCVVCLSCLEVCIYRAISVAENF
jgi:ferredoxin